MMKLWNKNPTVLFGSVGVLVILLLPTLVLSACSQGDDVGADSLYVRDVSGGIFDASPVRDVSGVLGLHRDGDVYECSMCHDGYRDDPEIDPLGDEHSDIVFEHGLERRCLDCHNPTNSDVYLNHDGTEIAGDGSTLLCAKCHGVTFRDWKAGVHGRRSGYWDAAFGSRLNLDCIQCHDPHRPRFPQMKPDPAPILSRFGVGTNERNEGESDE
jgi:hypothetical protein